MKIKFFPIFANIFCDAWQVPILRYFEACVSLVTGYSFCSSDWYISEGMNLISESFYMIWMSLDQDDHPSVTFFFLHDCFCILNKWPLVQLLLNSKNFFGFIPVTHNSIQSYNSIHFLLFMCLTSLIKDSGSLHSALVVKTEICGEKTGFWMKLTL